MSAEPNTVLSDTDDFQLLVPGPGLDHYEQQWYEEPLLLSSRELTHDLTLLQNERKPPQTKLLTHLFFAPHPPPSWKKPEIFWLSQLYFPRIRHILLTHFHLMC